MKKRITSERDKPINRSRATAERYLYTVRWSSEDEAYVARVAEFPSLAAHGDSQETALRELQQVVKAVLKDIAALEGSIPRALGHTKK